MYPESSLISSLTTARYLDLSEAAGSRKEKKNCQMAESKTELCNLTGKKSIYRMRALITRGLYTFYPLFEVQKRFFKEPFS